MDFKEYKLAFEEAASNSGFSADNIQSCLNYAEGLFQNNVPVIYNTSHLSALVGYKKDYIKRAAIYTSSYYRNFVISKRNGNPRIIAEPLPSLKEIQHWILENILQFVPVSPFAKAYRKNISLIDNIKFHKKQHAILSMDIKNFFTSIKIDSIEKIFLSLGYSKLISNLLAKLCTKDGVLPQGAPTSPYLSNLFFKETDDLIFSYCSGKNIRYTRYADDLIFSGEFDETALFNYVKDCIQQINLSINGEKTKLMRPNQRQTVTGIVVNEKAQVAFSKRNILRQKMFYIKKFGLKNHIEHEKISKANYLEHLLGQINFIVKINPIDNEFQEYKKYLTELMKSR